MMSEEQILLGTNITDGYWTRPVSVHNTNLQQIHGHIFSINTLNCANGYKNGTLFPSEFREGPSINIGSMDNNFIADFTDYLWKHGWESTFGLEVMDLGKMIEFSFDIGSLLLDEDRVTAEMKEENSRQFKFQNTGWRIKVADDGAVDQTGEIRCVIYAAGHVKITNGQIKNVLDVMEILEKEGVLVSKV